MERKQIKDDADDTCKYRLGLLTRFWERQSFSSLLSRRSKYCRGSELVVQKSHMCLMEASTDEQHLSSPQPSALLYDSTRQDLSYASSCRWQESGIGATNILILFSGNRIFSQIESLTVIQADIIRFESNKAILNFTLHFVHSTITFSITNFISLPYYNFFSLYKFVLVISLFTRAE